MNSPKHNLTAFTLIELLTVIAIIGILAGILIPTVTAARNSAHDVHCRSNLRQLGIAFIHYGHDHRGVFPVAATSNDNWAYQIYGYMGGALPRSGWQWGTGEKGVKNRSPYFCLRGARMPDINIGTDECTNYAMNTSLSLVNTSRLLTPSRVCLLIDAAPRANGTAWYLYVNAPGTPVPARPHGGKSYIAYADAHVGEMKDLPSVGHDQFWQP